MLYIYNLQLKEEVIIKAKQYPIAQTLKEATNLERRKWGIIGKAESSHYNPLHVVRKADRFVRTVLDLRKLNQYIIIPQNQVESIDSSS